MRRMTLIAAVLLLAAAFTRAADSPAPTTAATDDAPPPKVPLPPGMTPLFDGKTLDGWTQIPANSWTVRNGAIASVGAGRGVIYSNREFSGTYRLLFDIRHVSGKPDHQACVLVFCTPPSADGDKPLDALAGIQFQVPNGGHWDYRKGHNNAGKEEFTALPHPKFDPHQWSRVELLIDTATGTGRMAVAQPVGTPAVEVLQFKDPAAGRQGPFALQMHNKGLFDEYANIAVEPDPADKELITVKPAAP
jgi:hypothetical protein